MLSNLSGSDRQGLTHLIIRNDLTYIQHEKEERERDDEEKEEEEEEDGEKTVKETGSRSFCIT